MAGVEQEPRSLILEVKLAGLEMDSMLGRAHKGVEDLEALLQELDG